MSREGMPVAWRANSRMANKGLYACIKRAMVAAIKEPGTYCRIVMDMPALVRHELQCSADEWIVRSEEHIGIAGINSGCDYSRSFKEAMTMLHDIVTGKLYRMTDGAAEIQSENIAKYLVAQGEMFGQEFPDDYHLRLLR